MSTMVTLTTVSVHREDREEHFQPELIGRIQSWVRGIDGTPVDGSLITLMDNDDTELNVRESPSEVRRRIECSRAFHDALAASTGRAGRGADPWVWVLVERLPWRAIRWFAYWWAVYQGVRVLSLVQDIVIEQTRVGLR